MDGEFKNSILIVDDEVENLNVLTQILGVDYNVITALNGVEAIEKAAEYKPDLILLDIIMPEMNGYQTLAKIRENDGISNIPVIFITGLDSDEDEEKGLSLNAADYITKPFSTKVVKLRVHNQMLNINHLRTMERRSLIDQLTNLPNRRSFDERLNIEWKHSVREQTPISILMMDLDKFKILNDTYGHQQGDVVLQTFAKVFPKSFRRSGDFGARWGGEEFIVFLPNTHLCGAMEIAEKIRVDVENTEIPCAGGTPIKITISIGVNSLIPGQNNSIEEFISNADKALYAAKQAGRNKIMHC